MPDIDEDPFASAPADEAQAAPQPDPEPEPAADPEPAPAPAKKAPAKKAASSAVAPVVVNSSDGKVVVTLKGGASFDDPWIVIHADSTEDALDHFMGERGAALGTLMERAQNAAKGFVKLGGGTKSASNGNGGQASRGSAPQGATEAPSWAPPKPFDDFVYVTKVSAKTGKPWHAWMAPNKNDGRDPLFFNPPR